MIEFGKTLKAAREAKGLTIADIAAQTHIMSSMIADLENDDFSHLAAPIYGRGFVKLYCETVGLAPEPMIAEFMEIYNGNREPAIRERVVPTVPEPEPAPASEITPQETEPSTQRPAAVEASEPPVNAQLDLFSAPPPARPAPAQPEEPVREPEPQPKKEHPFAQYATPFRECASEFPRFAPAFGRWCVVAVVLFLVIGGLIAGIRALYRATSGEAVSAKEPAPTAPVPTATDTRTSRTPLDVPPLYVD